MSGPVDGHPGVAATGPHPASPAVAAPPSEAAAWCLAFVPLGTVLGYAFSAIWGVTLGFTSFATLAASAGLVTLDKRGLARSGRLSSSAAPSTGWLLFPPVYLFRRARALALPRTQAWIAVACFALAFAGRTALVARFAGAPADADAAALPACADRAVGPDLLKVFDEVSEIRTAGIHGVVLTGQIEIGQGPGPAPTLRFCTGKVEASDTRVYDIRYDLELKQSQVVIRVEVQP